MAILQRMNSEQGLSVVPVMHEADIAQYAKRIIVFKDGSVVRAERLQERRSADRELADSGMVVDGVAALDVQTVLTLQTRFPWRMRGSSVPLPGRRTP
jgi:ABC-type phosphate/phosphonate transport system ATPase subunit